MPTIQQLPNANVVSGTDEIPIDQSGVTNSVTVATLLADTQPSIVIAQDTLLGRVSLGPGGPEAVQVGTGVQVASGALSANGADHATYAEATALVLTNEAILNSAGVPMRMPLSLLSGLFSAGSNVAISAAGQISAGTDPSVTAALASLSQTVTGAQPVSGKNAPGGYAGLDAGGNVTAPVIGSASLATVQASWAAQGRTLAARASDAINVADLFVTGDADATAMWTRALAAAAANPGLRLYAPGRGAAYALSAPLAFSGANLAIEGDGTAETVLAVGHSGVGLTVTQTDATRQVRLRRIGFTAAAAATGAIAVNYPAYKSVAAVNARSLVAEGIAVSGGFATGLSLSGLWNAIVRDYEFWCAGGEASGVAAVAFGQCIGLDLDRLAVYAAGIGLLQTDYAERVRVRGATIAALQGFAQAAWTASAGAAGMDGNAVNLVDLRVEECDVSGYASALDLALVSGASLQHNRLSANAASAAGTFVARIDGMALGQVSRNVVSGPGYAAVAAGQGTVGLWLRNTHGFGYGNRIGANQFGGVTNAVLLDSGAGEYHMDAPNDHYEPALGHLDSYVDASGTATNVLSRYVAANGAPIAVAQSAGAGFAFAGGIDGDASAATAGGVALGTIAATATGAEPAANKGQPNGFAGLDASGNLQLGGVTVIGETGGQTLLLVKPPTSDPGVVGAVWNNGQYLCVSTGAA